MAHAETVTVRVAEGLLRGMKVAAQGGGGTYWSFEGVPYATPPAGPLRFLDAQPLKPWEGVRDAFAAGGISVQHNGDTGEIVGSEDCLYLNVFTAQRPGPGAVPLPVMVFVHGGGFTFGAGNADVFGPDFLVLEGVLVVTMNYRLGAHGFLFLEEAAPGNVGLKDQVAALRWVQRNIAAFGGDPDNVTLFGFSAGATSTHMHMLSPMSKGLFHRAISMSGAALNPWAVQTEPADTTRRLARLLGCTSDDPHAIVDFLRNVDLKELTRVALTEAVPEKDKKRLVTFGIVPTNEVQVPGIETFLPGSAEKLMKEGRHHNIPYMTGIVENEGYLALMFADILNESVAKKLDAKWEDNVLPELRIRADNPKNKDALEEIRRFFFRGKPLSGDTLQKNLDLFSDLTINEGVYYAIRCMANFPKAPLYQYLFTVDEKFNHLKRWKNIVAPGAAHADDLGYLFRTEFNLDSHEDSAAVIVRRRMVRLWTNFAKTGDPTPEDDPLLGVRWKPYTADERNFLEIGPQLRNGTDLYADRVAFWERFYNTYGS